MDQPTRERRRSRLLKTDLGSIALQCVGLPVSALGIRTASAPFIGCVPGCSVAFVSLCLERAGLFSRDSRAVSIDELERMLVAGGWRRSDRSRTRPGDVCLAQRRTRAAIVASYCNDVVMLVGVGSARRAAANVFYDFWSGNQIDALFLAPPRATDRRLSSGAGRSGNGILVHRLTPLAPAHPAIPRGREAGIARPVNTGLANGH